MAWEREMSTLSKLHSKYYAIIYLYSIMHFYPRGHLFVEQSKSRITMNDEINILYF